MGGCTNIRFVGILNHYGSQMNSVEGYRKNGQFLVGIANSLLEKCGIKISVFNIGGGFPESFVIPKNHFMDYLQEMKQIFSETGWGECSVYYEPGRYIVGGAGFLLASIVKKNEEFRTYFLDVGINIIPQFARSSLRFHNVDKICEEAQEKYDIMGIVPSDQDILAKNYNFQNTSEVGDKVIISGVGAYTITFSTRFPYQFPTILFCENDEISVFRSRGDSEDVSLY
jgi:diaminopimelate decarboxylase